MNVRREKVWWFSDRCFFKIILLVVLEVEERKQFLDQMAALGKRKEYQQVISNEIADVSLTKTPFDIELLIENDISRKYAKWN